MPTPFRHLLAVSAFFAAAAASSIALADPVALEVGEEHACVVTDCGDVTCWGGPNQFFEEMPEGVSGPYVDVAVGDDHTCVLDDTGFVECFGRADDERLEPPTDDFESIDGGMNHTCGVRTNNRAACWGNDTDGKASPPFATVNYRQIDAGRTFTCGVTTGRNAVDCWGKTPFGVERLLSWDILRDHGTAVGDPERFNSVSVGLAHFCVTTTYGAIYCFGEDNGAGQLSALRYMEGADPIPTGTPVTLEYMPEFEDHSTFSDDVGPMFFQGHRQGGRIYVGIDAGMLGNCAVYQSTSGGYDHYCFGYPFDYGWGNSLPLTLNPEIIDVSHHNFCGWNQSIGEIDCVSEFPTSTLDDIPPLSDCS